MAPRRSTGLVLALVLAVTGCTWADREPGLFGRSTPVDTPGPTLGPVRADPALPVVGETVWRAGDGSGLSVRIAVHAVRRLPGATVLDYSVTPLPDAARPLGSLLPSSVDLGLGASEAAEPEIFLLEPRGRRLYRPLTRGQGAAAECLCPPISVLQQNLRVARTTLMQVVFPALPATVSTVDVVASSIRPFWNVPVTAAGRVPLASAPYDLTQPPESPAVESTPLRTRVGGQDFSVAVQTVQVARSFTALVWTIRSVSSGPGLATTREPPFREAGLTRLRDGASAGAPTVQPAGRAEPLLRSRLVAAGDRWECVCTDLSLPAAALASAGREVTAITVLPALPSGTAAVDVGFPGAGVVHGVPTTTASDGAFRSAGPVRRQVGTWVPAGGPPLGWSVEDWPTPLPAPREVSRFEPVVEDLVR